MSGTTAGTDVVIVPDFAGPKRTVFEVRTLFFLASWLALGERIGRSFRPHICAIGEPPASVLWLAECACAEISIHEPLLLTYEGFANKLRGLESLGNSARALMLDADVLLLGELDIFTAIDADLAAAPAGKPQVPETQWRIIYESLGLPLPTERMASVYGEHHALLDRVEHRYSGQDKEAAAMLPYYNSGVLLVRRGVDLRSHWENCLRRIPELFRAPGRPAPAHAINNGDQVALAVALHALQQQGHTLAILPHSCNARLVHFRTGALRVGDVQLLHAAGFGGHVERRVDIGPAMENYETRWCEAIAQGLRDQPAECAADQLRARAFLRNLWETWVREAWEASPD